MCVTLRSRTSVVVLRLFAVVLAMLSVTLTATRTAEAKPCEGPVECCPASPREPASAQVVHLGVVLVGLYNVNEKLGTWDADFYLNESWTAVPEFTPTTEIVNEVTRQSPTCQRRVRQLPLETYVPMGGEWIADRAETSPYS